ncbi:elongation of very long chain fatty acids protein 4-like [Scleropages formosus]|uniref:Elongation of very long chain fatty acids protein n=1 Tax=Scleropages formosus TaxID=113540 RepID=A0A0P7XFC9_SCLFO|nr:elongation of very long chain fatty acids protein 4-like [Scleropages formosus]
MVHFGMALLAQRIQTFYQWVLDNGDKRTDSWLLVYSPVPMTGIFILYLLSIWAGPKIMKNREPVNLKGVLIGYNFAMVGLSAYMFHEFLVTAWLANYSLLCQPVDYSNSALGMRMAKVCWWFFFSKVIELSDTFFFILRKKNSQLTFLHVYHHGTMIFNWWAGVKYVAGAFLIGVINTFVHIQFFILTIHTGYNYFAECDFPDSMNAVVLAYSISLIFLFSNFYYQNYLGKKSKKT